ncbi:hypothetical protein BURPSPAST_AB0166 [Burkholderia pseudomallei Pasteur 52237]|nr:hypothetical protein BURPSPAST_AB0166 [Burkholderia pseudomallei Pasteur 52237]
MACLHAPSQAGLFSLMPHALQCDAARHGTLTRNAEHARRDHRRRARSSRFTRASLFDRIGIVRSLSD